MRIVSNIGVELLGGIFILICLILALKYNLEYADKNSVPYVSHFETFDFEMAQELHNAKSRPCLVLGRIILRRINLGLSHFEIVVINEFAYIRKGEKFQMKKSFLDFVKSQLEEIRISKNAEYSSGIAATLIAYIEAENPPEVIEMSVTSVRNGNLINAIKTMRIHTGMGLKEAKDAVEKGLVFYKGDNTNEAIKMYKALSEFTNVKIVGSAAMQTLFGQN